MNWSEFRNRIGLDVSGSVLAAWERELLGLASLQLPSLFRFDCLTCDRQYGPFTPDTLQEGATIARNHVYSMHARETDPVAVWEIVPLIEEDICPTDLQA